MKGGRKLVANARNAHLQSHTSPLLIQSFTKEHSFRHARENARFANMRLNVMGQQAYPIKCPTNV